MSTDRAPDDRPLARLLRNALTLFSGNVGAQLVGLLATVLAGRALGPEAFGVLALLQTYVMIVDMLVNFQSWQALITFGSDALAQNRREDFKALIKMGALLDLVTAVIGAALALALAGTYARLQGWEVETTRLAMLYSLVILVHLSGVPTAVLRLFDRFRLIAAQQIAASAIRVVGVLIAIAADADLATFVVVWILAEAGGYVTLLALGWRQLGRQGYSGIWRTPVGATRRRYPTLLSFVVTTNLNLSLKLSAREADTMIVGATLGDAPAGIYKIAKQLAGILAKVADPLYQAVFPELARLWSSGAHAAFRRLVVRSTLLATGGAIVVWVGFLLLGKPFIRLTVGDAYVAGHPAMLAYMAAIVLAVAGFALSPAMLAMGRPRPGFMATLASTIVYFATLYAFLSAWQLVGAGLAYALYYVVWTAIMGTLVARAGRGAA